MQWSGPQREGRKRERDPHLHPAEMKRSRRLALLAGKSFVPGTSEPLAHPSHVL